MRVRIDGYLTLEMNNDKNCQIFSDGFESSIIYNQKNIIGYGAYHVVLSDKTLNRLYRCPNDIPQIYLEIENYDDEKKTYQERIQNSVEFWNKLHAAPEMQARIEKADDIGIAFKYKSAEPNNEMIKVDNVDIMTVPRVEGMTISDYEDEIFKEYFKDKLSRDAIDALSNITLHNIDQFVENANTLISDQFVNNTAFNALKKESLFDFLNEFKDKCLDEDIDNYQINKMLNEMKFSIGKLISSNNESFEENINAFIFGDVTRIHISNCPFENEISKKAKRNLMIPIMDEIVRIYQKTGYVILDGHFANFIYNYDDKKNIKATCIDIDDRALVNEGMDELRYQHHDPTGMAWVMQILAHNYDAKTIEILIGDDKIKQDLFEFIKENIGKYLHKRVIKDFIDDKIDKLNELDELNLSTKQAVLDKINKYKEDRKSSKKFTFLTPIEYACEDDTKGLNTVLSKIETAKGSNQKYTNLFSFSNKCGTMLAQCEDIINNALQAISKPTTTLSI